MSRFSAPEAIRERSGQELKWIERPRVTPNVDADTRLGDVLDNAAEHFGITLLPDHSNDGRRPGSDAIVGFAFYRETEGQGTSDISSRWPILNKDNVIRWVEGLNEIPLQRLIASSEAGLFEGDPTRVYLVPCPHQGVLSDFDWSLVLRALENVDEVLIHIGATYAGLQGIRSIVRAGTATLRRLSRYLAGRGATVDDVLALAQRRSWTTADFAAMLGLAEPDAEALLGALGCGEDERGLWRQGGTQTSRATTVLIKRYRLPSAAE